MNSEEAKIKGRLEEVLQSVLCPVVEKDRERIAALVRWHKQQQDLADWWKQESSPLDELE